MQRRKLLVALYYKTRNRGIVDDAVLIEFSDSVTLLFVRQSFTCTYLF